LKYFTGDGYASSHIHNAVKAATIDATSTPSELPTSETVQTGLLNDRCEDAINALITAP